VKVSNSVTSLLAAALLAASIANDAVEVASAARESLRFEVVTNAQLQQPVEQQSDYPFDSSGPRYVVNPTQCSWDVDDSWQRIANDDYLDAGASATLQTCMVSDASTYYASHNGTSGWWASNRGYFGALVYAAVSGLAVSVCYAPQARCFHPQPQFNASQRRYDYVACTQVVYQQGDPALVSIPGSNGGTGVITNITLKVSNPTAKQIRSIGADIQVIGVGSKFVDRCGYAALPAQEYPWFFTLSGTP